MLQPLQISFHNMAPSEALSEAVRARAGALEVFYPDIVGCRVVLDLPHGHRERGRGVQVRIALSVPGPDIVVSREATQHGNLKGAGAVSHHKGDDVATVHKHALVAIHEAFDRAGRQLQDFAARQRGLPRDRGASSRGP